MTAVRAATAFAASFLLLLCPARSEVSASQKAAILGAHNTYRCMHDVPLFKWDDAVAASAQAKVDIGEWVVGDAMVGNEQCSENLAWGLPLAGERATEMWYDQIKTTPNGAGLIPEYTRSCGYYSQVVWKSSVRIGCGRGPRNEKGGDYNVCYYCPGGNVRGGFVANVLAPSKTAEQCANPETPTGADGNIEAASTAARVKASAAALVFSLGVAAIAV